MTRTLHQTALGFLHEDRYQEALAPLGRLVLQLPPTHPALPGCLVTLAFAYEQLGRTSEARRAVRRALKLRPQLRVAHLLLARVSTAA